MHRSIFEPFTKAAASTIKALRQTDAWLSSSVCSICNQTHQKWGTSYICMPCWSVILAPPTVKIICPDVRHISCGPYMGWWRAFLIQAKWKQDLVALHTLEFLLKMTLQTYIDKDSFDYIVGIPSSKIRSIHRGGDLIKHFTHQIHKHSSIPIYKKGLAKTRYVKRQSKIADPKNRRKNVKDIFCSSPALRDKRILLFDDVATTGATLKSAISALKLAKPDSITCLTLLSKPS